MSKRFWLIASLFYIGVLLTNLAFYFGGECGFAFIPQAQPFFVSMIVMLLALEWLAYQRYRDNMTHRVGVGLLLAHMVLFEVTSAVDCTATTTFLYLLIPFMAYLFVNRWTAFTLALLYSIWFAAYFQIFRVDPLGDYLFRAVIFELSIVFSLAMAGVVKEVLVSQAQERRLHRELQKAHDQLEGYARQVKELGAMEERNRLARDIHDSIGHYLAAVTVQLEKALAFQSKDPAKSERAIRDANQAARDALRDVRRSVGSLRQSAEFFSLIKALQDLVRRSSNDQLTVDLRVEGEDLGYSNSILMVLYRVAQEGITNIQRHARANKVKITLQMDNENASLKIEDNGQGFDVSKLEPLSQDHQGLRGMRERLELAGGKLMLESDSHIGTRLIAMVPKRPPISSEGAL